MTSKIELPTESKLLKISGFTEHFIRVNDLTGTGFRKWVFKPGMQFNSLDKWWGDFGSRNSEHEGLDFCLYEDKEGMLHEIGKNAKVPAMYAGRVVGFIHDFLGESVILCHEHLSTKDQVLCTLYAHTRRRSGLVMDENVDEGDVIAMVADAGRSKSGISPHLHISAAWMKRDIVYENLDWATIGQHSGIFLIDPLSLFQ